MGKAQQPQTRDKLSSSLSAPPPNFPTSVHYLTACKPSARLPKSLVKTYCSPCPSHMFPTNGGPTPRVGIKRIQTSTHPACGQAGLFALQHIPARTWIRDYLGVVHLEQEADSSSDYDLSLARWSSASPSASTGNGNDDGTIEVIGVDATEYGNETRFVNDFRGVATRPNAVFELRRWRLDGKLTTVTTEPKAGAELEGDIGVRMAVWSGPQGIRKGDEILVSYGRGFWSERRKEEQGIRAANAVADGDEAHKGTG